MFRLMARPRYSSLVPAEYPLAVSKKLMPRSRAWRMTVSLCPSSSVQSCIVPACPKLIQPTHSLEISMPVVPNFVYCMVHIPPLRPFILEIAASGAHSATAGRARPSTQLSIADESALPLNRWPESQLASGARSCIFVALEPMPLLPEVQKGTMVLPSKL